MTSKIRLSTNDNKLAFLHEEIYKMLNETTMISGAGLKNIKKWSMIYTGASAGALTEIDAPDAAFDGSVEEVTTVLFTNTKIASLGSEYLSVPFSAAAGGSSSTMHDFYVDKQETTTVTCPTKANTIGSGSFHFWVDNGAGCETEYYVFFTKPEISTVTCLAKADCVGASTFHFYVDNGAGGEVHYYCWMNVSGTDSDPTETGTAIECDISGATTATDVAEVIDGLIDAKANVGAANAAAILTITNDNNGGVTDCGDGEGVATGFTFSIEQGGDDQTESGTGIEADISGSTTAIDVAEVVDGLINAKTDVGCDNGGTANLPIINANNGNVTNASHGTINSGCTISIEGGGDDPNRAGCCTITCSTVAAAVESSSFHFFVADGSGGEDEYYIWINKGAGSDPTESGTAIECDISGGIATAIEVAELIDSLIAAKTDVGCDNGGTATLPIINAQAGSVTDPYDGTGTATGWSFIFQDGTLDSGAAGTAHSCDISAATSAADVGTIFVAAITAVAGLTSTGTTTALIESDNTGDITDVTQSGSSLGTITVVNQGRASYEGGYLYIVSASANDNDIAAGHVRTVNVVGWDNNGVATTVSVAMAGATKVKLGTRLKAVSHMYAATFGTGDDDAADAITLLTSNTTNATTLLTIAQNATESNGFRFYLPDGASALISRMEVFNLTNANTGATEVVGYMTGFDHIKNADADLDTVRCVCGAYGAGQANSVSQVKPLTGTDTAILTLKESEVGTEGNETFMFILELFTFE